jgi:hypothetical protein
MAMTTIRASQVPREARSLTRPVVRSDGAYGAVQLTLIATATAIVGAMTPAVLTAFIVAATTGSWEAAASVASLSLPFLMVTVPTSAIWLVGAINTRRTIRRLHGHD